MSNTEAAQLLLKADPLDLAQLGEILSDIVRDEQRASEIISGLGNLLNNRTEADLQTLDLNDTVRDVVKIVSPEVTRRGVILRTILATEPLWVRCDPIHLQQVIINLVMNGVDAMEKVPNPHNLTIRTIRLIPATSRPEYPTPARVSPTTNWSAFSTHSSRRNRKGRGWDCRSRERSLKVTAASSGLRTAPAARCSPLSFRWPKRR